MASSADFEALLLACLSFNNQSRKQAEDAIKQLSNKPQVVPELVQRIQVAADPQVRQLAAVLLRKWTARHWSNLSTEVKSGTQGVLLERIVQEPVHSVRRALADVVAAVASLSVPDKQWPGLLEFLHQCSKAKHMEVGLLLFAALFETIGEHLHPHVPAILQAVAASTSHPSTLVQSAALAAIEPLLPYITDSQVPAFHQLLGTLLPLAQRALAAGNEDLLLQLCQVLAEVAESPAPLLQPYLQQVLEMCMTVATQQQFESSTREQALHLVNWTARFKPKQMTRHKSLMRAIVDALFEMCCEPLPADYDDAQELPPQKFAAQALDTLALHLSSQHVFPPAWQFAQSSAAAPDPNRRAAALMVLAVLAEGCAQPLKKRLTQALPLLLSAMTDQTGQVRGAAAFALGQFSEYLQPDIMQHYEQVMPGAFSLLHDADSAVQERACYALDVFCENLEPSEILPYVPQLMQQLLRVLHNGNSAVQEMALSAVSSVAAAAQQLFQPYVGQLLPVLHHFMQQITADQLQCRCRAVESAGILVSALGPSDPVLGPHIGAMTELTLQCFTSTDSPDLRDACHGMFSHAAVALKEGFAPYLPRVVHLACTSCRQEDGQLVAGDRNGPADADANLGSSCSDDSDAEQGEGPFNVRTGVMDEKMSATSALGSCAEACQHAFMPFAEETLAVLTEMCHYWHEDVRAAAYDSLQKLLLATHMAFPGISSNNGISSGSTPNGVGSHMPVVLSQQARAMADAVLPLLLSPVDDDVSKSAVAAAAAALAKVLKTLGQGAVKPAHLEAAAMMAHAVILGKALCQEVEDDDDEDDADDELAEEDEELLGAAADMLPALATAMGPDAYVAVFLELHAEPLLQRLKPQQQPGMRAIAAGAAAEVVEVLGQRVAPVVSAALPLLLREMLTEDDINRQNAAYCSGLLVEASPEQAMPHLQQLLVALHNMFRPDEAQGARDNAAGAVGRMICALPHALPLVQVLPVFLGGLPLQEDLSETTPVVAALCKLLQEENQEVQQYVPQIVQAFGQVVMQVAAPTEAKLMVARTLRDLQSKYPQEMSPLLGQLPSEQQTALQRLVTASDVHT